MIVIAVDSVLLGILSILALVVFAQQNALPVPVHQCALVVFRDTTFLRPILASAVIILDMAAAPAIGLHVSNV